MEYTPISDVTPVEHPAADRAAAYGLDGIIVDGNDVDAVFEVAGAALARARQGEGPSLIEAKTYRHGGHSRADPGKYRPDEEVAAWMKRDPIILYRTRLEELGVDPSQLDQIESDASAEVDEATDITKASPTPHPDTLETNVWADGGSSWRN
jgi:pyruvate dehydrogenase E1 component alpha subunit